MQRKNVIANNMEKIDIKDNLRCEYLDLLMDNSPQAYSDYNDEALILNNQINNSSVFNIAIVARYGAGKSSVINTYLDQYRKSEVENKRKRHYVKISLATFMGTDYDEIAVERSILQQLLYSHNKEKLPNSKIERTNRTSIKQSALYAGIFSAFIISVVLLGLIFGGVLLWPEPFKYVFLGAAIISLCLILYCAFYYKKFKRLRYKDLEADFQDSDKEKPGYITNLINKFVDEVLYFFECIDINLVIFEDLDRLPDTEIFSKLRELNTIINSSNKRARKVTFLYAIRDDLFKIDEERAKFFEFILPVISVINPVTTKAAIDNIVKDINAKNPNMGMTDRFLKSISVYIPDMRILKNTFNDYIIMYHKIFEREGASQFLKTEKLFAICLYKNLYPYDYALLEKNEGLIPLIIDMSRLHNDALKNINEELDRLEQHLVELHKESLQSFEELKCMFIGQITSYPFGNSYGIKDAASIDTFEGLNPSDIKHPIVRINGNYSNADICIQLPVGQSKFLTPTGESYVYRERVIKEKENYEVDKIKRRITELEKQKQDISVWRLKDVTDNLGVDICFTEEIKTQYMKDMKSILLDNDQSFSDSIAITGDVKDRNKDQTIICLPMDTVEKQLEFLRFLISQNYIDEHYIEYTSDYRTNLISRSDVELIKSIQRFQDIEFNSKIENLEEVIKWLNEQDFLHSSILIKPILSNLTLLSEVSKQDENDKKYTNLLKLLSDVHSEKVLAAIIKFIDTSDLNECYKFLQIVIPKRPTLCSEVLKADLLSIDKKDLILTAEIKFAVNYAKEDDIVRDYISRHNSYMKIFDGVGNTDKVIRFLTEVSPVFVRMQYLELDSNIQQEIINNHRYVLSLHNLQVIFDIDDIAEDYSYFYNKNYDTIIHSGKKPVISYIDDNIETYVKDILLNDKISCDDEPIENLIELLNNEKIPIAVRRELIGKIHAVFEDIKQFPTELYTDLLNNRNIVATWANVGIVYEHSGFDGIKTFLEYQDKIDGNLVDPSNISIDTSIALINDILIGLSVDKIRIIARSLPVKISLSKIKLVAVADENLAVFVAAGCITYANTDLILVYNKPQTLTQYLIVHKDSVLQNFDSYFEKALPTISSKQVYNNGRYENIRVYNEKQHSQNIIAAVIGCNGIDLDIKCKLIDKCSEIIKITGYDLVYSTFIISEKMAVPAKILWQFTNSNINTSDKITILSICNYGADINGNIDLNQIRAYLISCGEPYALLYQDNKKVYMEKTEQNEQLLKVLKNTGIVKSYKKVRNHEEYEIQVK